MVKAINTYSQQGALGSGFLFLLIFSVVLSNQSDPSFQTAGRLMHLASILAAFVILYFHASLRVGIFFASLALIYAVGEFGHRPPYEAALLAFSFFVGLNFANKDMDRASKVLSAVTVVTAIVMFLQVTGTHEALFLLSTHGYLSDGRSIPIDLTPTFLIDYYSLGGNFLQGRPSGILHSNQFATFVILMTISFFLALRQKVSHAEAALLSIAAVLTLSKVLTVYIIVLYFFGRKRKIEAQRINCNLIVRYYFAFLVIYFLFFPGVVTTYFLNPHTIVASMAVRLIDILVPLGFDRVYLEKLFAALMNWLSGNPHSKAITNSIIIEISGASRVSLYTSLVGFSGQISFLVSTLILMSITSKSFWERISGIFRSFYVSPSIFPTLGLAVFSLAADFSGMALFWLFAGITIALASVSNDAHKDLPTRSDKSTANSESMASQDGTA